MQPKNKHQDWVRQPWIEVNGAQTCLQIDFQDLSTFPVNDKDSTVLRRVLFKRWIVWKSALPQNFRVGYDYAPRA